MGLFSFGFLLDSFLFLFALCFLNLHNCDKDLFQTSEESMMGWISVIARVGQVMTSKRTEIMLVLRSKFEAVQ